MRGAMDAVIDWLNDNSGAVQAIAAGTLVVVTGVLVCVTAVYASSTRRMAGEMAHARRDSLRPIIGITPRSREDSVLPAKIDNYGVGPALDVWFRCLEGDGKTVKEDRIDVLAVDADERAVRIGAQPRGHLSLFIDPVSGEAQVHYRDVFGNKWTTALKLKGIRGRARDEMVLTEGWPDTDD